MDTATQLRQLVTIAGAVFAFIEFLKPYIKIYFAPIEDFNDDTKAAIYRLLNAILCIGIVLTAGNELNLFKESEFLGQTFPFIGLFLTGFATGMGGTFLNFVAAWASMNFITVPAAKALLWRAEALKLATNTPSATARALEAEIKDSFNERN